MTVSVARTVVLSHSDNMCTVGEMATLSCSCPDAMMSCETGDNGGMLFLVLLMIAYALYAQCGGDGGDCSDSDDDAPEGMFT